MSVAPYFAPGSNVFNTSVGPNTVGYTPAGPRGFQIDFKGFTDLGQQRNLLGETMQANFSQLWASGNQTTGTIESNVYGQLYTTLSAVATYRDVCALGYWTQRLLPVYEITYIHRVQQRFMYRTIEAAQRTGHLDTQKGGSTRMFSFQRVGHRNGTTAYARHEELYGPLEYAIPKRDFMMDQIFYGHAHTHAHDLVDALIRETYVRYWVESGGTRMTNERFMVDELLRVANTFAILNYGTAYASGRLAEYARQIPGADKDKLGVLPYAARRIHAGLLRSHQIPAMLGMVSMSNAVAMTLGTGQSINRSALVPADASLDSLVTDSNQLPKAFGNLEGIQIFLEPPVSLETAENNDYDTLLVHYNAKSEFVRHGLLGENSVEPMPHVFKIYDATTDRREIVDSMSDESLAATGVWKSIGSSYADDHYPGHGGVHAGFSTDFIQYLATLRKDVPSTYNDYVSYGYEAYEKQGLYSLDQAGKDALSHIFATYWSDRWGPAYLIGGMYPHHLRHWDTLNGAHALLKCLDTPCENSCEGTATKNVPFARLVDRLEKISQYFSGLTPDDKWADTLVGANRDRTIARDGAVQMRTNGLGGYTVPSWVSADATCAPSSYLAGFGSGPLLECLSEFQIAEAPEVAQQAQRVAELREIVPAIRERLERLRSTLKHNPLLARNMLPPWFDGDHCSVLANFVIYILNDNHYFVNSGSVGSSSGSGTSQRTYEDVAKEIFETAGGQVDLTNPTSVQNASGLAAVKIREAVKKISLDDLKKDPDTAQLIDKVGTQGSATIFSNMPTVDEAIKVSIFKQATIQDRQKRTRAVADILRKAGLRLSDSVDGEWIRTCLSFTGKLAIDTKGEFGCTRFRASDPTANFKSAMEKPTLKTVEFYYKDATSHMRSVERLAAETKEEATREAYFGAEGEDDDGLAHLYRRRRVSKVNPSHAPADSDDDDDDDDEGDAGVRLAARGTSVLQTDAVVPSWQRNLLLWRLDQFSRERGALTNKAGYFMFLAYIMTPLLGNTMVSLARHCRHGVPFTVLNLRAAQTFVTFDMIFAKQFCVRVYRSPTLVFLQSGGPLQTIEVTSKVASNEYVDDPRNVIRVPEVYLHRQAGGRGTKFITPKLADQWVPEYFTMFNQKASIVPALERIAQPNFDAIDLNNQPSGPLLEEIQRGTLNMGPWTSQRFTVKYSHKNYFAPGLTSYADAKNALPQTSSSDHLNKFITGFNSVDNYRGGYHGYNVASFAELSSRQIYMNTVVFRGTHWVSERASALQQAKFKSERPGSPLNPLMRRALNEKGLNSRLLLDQQLELNRTVIEHDDF